MLIMSMLHVSAEKKKKGDPIARSAFVMFRFFVRSTHAFTARLVAMANSWRIPAGAA